MNTLLRWGKFNLVGAMGMGLQLAALALFNRWTAGHYLYASAAAIELTLLHNFMWHSHYTWRDRRDNDIRLRQFARFHLSNGLVSMLGNHDWGASPLCYQARRVITKARLACHSHRSRTSPSCSGGWRVNLSTIRIRGGLHSRGSLGGYAPVPLPTLVGATYRWSGR
jgi:putative flippase GtrA